MRVQAGRLLKIESFGKDYNAAILFLLSWEEDLNKGATETLLLSGIGELKNIGTTHASFLGMKDVPLPEWMPRLP